MNPINNADDTTNDKKWKVLNEKDRYNIELLLKEGYKIKNIAQALGRDRKTIEREIKRGTVIKMIENTYLSRNPKVPDYIEKKVLFGKRRSEKGWLDENSKRKTLKNGKRQRTF